ncbi:hypothetical protein BH09MYX1_BH09MYX1_55790 [soil metagenome]
MRLVFASLFALTACGGATTTDLFLDGSANDGSANDGSNGNDAGVNDSGLTDTGKDSPGPDCDALAKKAADLREKAIQCKAQSSGNPCDKQVEDFCCPLTVTGGERKEVTDFVAAVKAAKAAGCAFACPAIPCVQQPSNKCDLTGTCHQSP